ncbi:UDP-N-acetylmuramoyl-tripeptide--D-alanyl-D-alanine ligase [Candidatus Planktophila vernalis]|uniref:UDP-N-acetylmuramoyl-tripeptide--D-alanyl-D-alanine ligase n=1 Tax=Candidatus Planktophila vernalis TaxID=1884907 RepID=A0A249KTS6_9ACTN|nr:UDP-N-acetylmuramoyl-tripeptide--D-alanyl-D-alanine ligase [Candidatus Planktophila vernalis]ASY20079.1 UDP-N-acetylmuramoyl-tripeptide--D-alanyl-D-alanine ligase [Candidatus Planktophila vernalis]
MITLTAGEIALLVGGELLCDRDLLISKAPVFDSRLATPGCFFLALKGENADGHEFAADAYRNGAMFSLTSQRIDGPCIVVKDVLEALSILAAFVRKRLDKLVVIGITGSQGKTSTKDLLTHMLGAVGPTVAPAGSFNNDLGLPITLLQCDDRTRFCILEMGARHMGDIARLCEIAKPNIGVVLTVGTAHIGEFGSREVIAQTKGELIASLDKDGIAILGTYDEFTPKMASQHQGQVILFGEKADIQVRAADIEMREGRPHFDLVTPAGRDAVGMRAVGAHQVANALAVAAVGTALALPLELIASSLSTAEISSKWRMELHESADLLIINDAYNANPESMSAAMRALVLFAQERGGSAWAFVGKMNELGQTQAPQSAAIGALAVELGIDHLVEINAPEYGEPVGAMVIHQRPTIESALDLVDYFAPGDVVLVKASRSQGFEVLAESLERAWKEKSGVDS